VVRINPADHQKARFVLRSRGHLDAFRVIPQGLRLTKSMPCFSLFWRLFAASNSKFMRYINYTLF